MAIKELTCICCPMGCPLKVEMETDANGQITVQSVTGNTCPRGAEYGRKEVTNPTRIVTSTVRVLGAETPTVSCKTAADIPKGKIFDIMQELAGVEVTAPVHIGDVLLKNAAGTGVDIVATKECG